MTTQTLRKKSDSALAASRGCSYQPPPPAGSAEEALETALIIGWPGAFFRTSKDVERELLLFLLWEM